MSYLKNICGRTKVCDVSKFAGNLHLVDKRSRKFRCKNKRLIQLAQPKFCHLEEENEPKNFKILCGDEQTPVRIKMLSYPKVRKLIATRDEFDNIIDEEWRGRFTKLIKQSMSTVYSRLAKLKLPKQTKSEKWTTADWKRHQEWLKDRAKPKTLPHVHEHHHKKTVPLDELITTMYKLSRPRHPVGKFRRYCGYKSTVQKTALEYVPTERTLKLAEGKSKEQETTEQILNPFRVNPNALKFNPSERLIELAKPKTVKGKEQKLPIATPFGVYARALRAQSSQRTLELAKPKIKEDDDDEEPRPNVNPKALKAKPSLRTLELAKPRVYADV